MILPTTDADFENFSTDASVTTTSDMLDNTGNVTFVEVFVEHLALTLNVYYTPALIVLGSLGNILSIVVFFKSNLRVQSTSQYLTALALSDTLFLFQLLPPWLKAVGASTLFTRDGYCQLFVYLSYVTCNLSSWLVVAFTIERFVAVVYPLKRNAMCTVKRARYIIVSLVATTLLINLPVLRFAVPKGNDCNIDELLMTHAARFNLVDTAVAFTLPLAVIVVLNAWIMWGVYRLARARTHLVRQQRPFRVRGPAALNQPTHSIICTSQRSQQRVTKMLLIVSSVFVGLNLPAYTMRIVAYTNNMDEHEYSGLWAALQQVCLLFFNTNFGINFVLYCMTGQNFRHNLKKIFPFLQRGKLTRIALRAMNREPTPRASSVSTSFVHSFSTNNTEATNAGNNNGASNSAARCGCQLVAGPSGEGRACGGAIRRTGPARVDQPAPKRRRRREQRVIQRWRFDNSRQLRRNNYSVEPEQGPDNGNM